MDFYQFKVEPVFVERKSGDILYVYNSSMTLIKKIQKLVITDAGDGSIDNKKIIVNANNNLLDIIITNTCGKVIQHEQYDPAKAVFLSLDDSSINYIINKLSTYRIFVDSGILDLIVEKELLNRIPITLSSLTITVGSSTLIMYYTNVIEIRAYTSNGYKSISFDSEGRKM